MFKRFWWVFLVMLPVGVMVGFLAAAVVTYVMPKQYESQMTIEVKPLPLLQDGVSPRSTGCGVEFDKIKSFASLTKVVENLDLTHKWGVDQDAAVRILKGIVISENIRGTDLKSIRVRHTNREEARDIAAEVARTYRDYRVEIIHRDRDRDLAELNKAVKEQEEKVEERRKVLATIARTGSLLAGPDTLHDQDMIDAKREFETDQALLQSMRLQQIRATVAAKIPDENVVIHEEAQVADSPVSPNVTLNLILGAVGGFLISPLLALPVILLLSRLVPVKAAATEVEHA